MVFSSAFYTEGLQEHKQSTNGNRVNQVRAAWLDTAKPCRRPIQSNDVMNLNAQTFNVVFENGVGETH